MRHLLARIRRLVHRDDTAHGPTAYEVAVAALPINRSYTYCPTCWVGSGEKHNLSCPEVSPAQSQAFDNTSRGGAR